MEYRGYLITAEIETLERWEIGEDGAPTEWITAFDHFDVVGYHFDTDDRDKAFFQAMGQADLETLHELVDAHIAELAS